MKPFLPRLHVITDEVYQSRYTHAELARICTVAGADGIQYREKRDVSHDDHLSAAWTMFECASDYDSLLVINDYVWLATDIEASAIHLGQTDESVVSARERMGLEVLIGGTANSLEQAVGMDRPEVDYLGVGPIYGTQSKSDPAPRMGLQVLSEICEAVSKPVIAIGNIQPHNVSEVLEAGAYGIAVLSAIVCASDVGAATQTFCDEIARNLP